MSRLTIRAFLFRFRHAYLAGFFVLLGTNALALGIPWVLKLAIDNIQLHADLRFLHLCAFYIFLLALGYAGLRILSRIILFGGGRDVEAEVKQKIYEHMQVLDAHFFQRTPNGEILSLLTSDTNFIRLLFGLGFLNLMNGVILYTLAAALMFSLNPHLAFWAMLPYLLIIFLLHKVAPQFHVKSKYLQEQVAAITEFIQENVSGHEVLRSFGRQHAMEERFRGQNDSYLKASMALTKVRGVLFTSTGAIGGLGTLLLLMVGGAQVIRGEIGLGDFVAFSGFLSLLVSPTLMFGFVISIWNRGRASMERIEQFLNQENLLAEPVAPRRLPAAGKGAITFRHLHYAYPSDVTAERRAVLQDVSVEIPAEQLTAIVGPVGCGKSTLVSLLTKLYPPPAGSIFLDGVDITELSTVELRQKMAVVPQDTFLFSMTVAENIAFGMKEDNLPEAEQLLSINHAAALAQVGMASGERMLTLDTLVGERGVLVSGGQKQRIGIARALASQAQVMIFDEPFSSLDAKTANQLVESLQQEFVGHTIILITHKISLLRKAKQIIVLDDGRVTQTGDHDHLMVHSPLYRDLYHREELLR